MPRCIHYFALLVALSCCCYLPGCARMALGAQAGSAHFTVEGPFPQTVVTAVARLAEKCRRDQAIRWLGHELPEWDGPCQVELGYLAGSGGGQTSFAFVGGVPTQFTGIWKGSAEKLLADVVPHEVLHTVLATHFGRPIPRWADEGAATFAESSRAQAAMRQFNVEHLRTGRGIPTHELLAGMEYRTDFMAHYAQGASLTGFLIQHAGRLAFVDFIGSGLQEGWPKAVAKSYGYRDLPTLQSTWLNWVLRGEPGRTSAGKPACVWVPGRGWVCTRPRERLLPIPRAPAPPPVRAPVKQAPLNQYVPVPSAARAEPSSQRKLREIDKQHEQRVAEPDTSKLGKAVEAVKKTAFRGLLGYLGVGGIGAALATAILVPLARRQGRKIREKLAARYYSAMKPAEPASGQPLPVQPAGRTVFQAAAPPATQTEEQHYNHVVEVPDNRMDRAWSRAVRTMMNAYPGQTNTLRALERLKNQILKGEPTDLPTID